MKPDKKRQSQQAFNQQAATYDTAIQGSHARTLYPYLLQAIIHAWGDRVLDLGCGTGALTAQVLEQDPRRQVTGLDLSEQMLAQARARLGDRVNLECDMIGKYVEKLLQPRPAERPPNGLTREFLTRNGII